MTGLMWCGDLRGVVAVDEGPRRKPATGAVTESRVRNLTEAVTAKMASKYRIKPYARNLEIESLPLVKETASFVTLRHKDFNGREYERRIAKGEWFDSARGAVEDHRTRVMRELEVAEQAVASKRRKLAEIQAWLDDQKEPA